MLLHTLCDHSFEVSVDGVPMKAPRPLRVFRGGATGRRIRDDARGCATPRVQSRRLASLAASTLTTTPATTGTTTSDATMNAPGVFDKDALIAATKADLHITMQEEVRQGIEKAVDRTPGRLTDSVAVEARATQNSQHIHEMRGQVVQMQQQVAGVKSTVEKLTGEVAHMRARPAAAQVAGSKTASCGRQACSAEDARAQVKPARCVR